MTGRPIPRYSHSCVAPSPHSNTTLLLVGVLGSVNGRLEINSIDLSDINTPIVNLTTIDEQVLYWRSQSPIFCHNYPDFKPKDKGLNPVHIQQFDPNWTFDANAYPNGNIDLPSYFPGVALMSARNYVVVGHLGSASWSLAHTNTTNAVSGSSWTTFQLNPVDNFKVFSDDHMDRFPSPDPFLSVGTYILGSKAPARGHAVIFDTASSGWIYPTAGYIVGSSTYGGNMLKLESPVSVNMDNITLTSEAVGVTMGLDAYILDKSSDNSTIAYYINPGQSTLLQRVPVTGHSPRYSSTIVATSMGSQIAVYSTNANGPLFNTFDPTTRTWRGLDLNPPVASSPIPTSGVQPSPTNNGHSDIETSTLPLLGIIGGVLGALVLTVLAIFFAVKSRRRKHQSSTSRRAKNYDRNSKTELLEEQQCIERMVSTIRSPQFNPAQPYSPPVPGKSLGRNPQSPVLECIKFIPADLDFSSLPTRQHEHLRQQQHQQNPSSNNSQLGQYLQPSSSSLAPTLTNLSYQFNPSESDILGRRTDVSIRTSPSTSLIASTASSEARHSQAYSDATNFDHMSEYVPTILMVSSTPCLSSSSPYLPPSQNY
ncbi:MAG: hypothetical protein JOS17DRAFT_736877 [Linnemannia elongata]|nr:MAG: hypothetical protein JOS17DRAFT_736877 [Linnemannia elongata]